MTYQQLVRAIAKILPNATLGEDNDGQLIVYTNLSEVENEDELVDFDSTEDSE